jgi:topoisomerase-4 subunit B
VIDGAAGLVSVFIEQPQFQGQTKEKLVSVEATKLVETIVGDNFEHWLTGDKEAGTVLLEHVVAKAEERLRRKQDREQQRKTATRKLRLPGKLADCSNSSSTGTEIFLVEGDSAGGSAKAARNRETQAILPLRGKILNVASASADKLRENQEVQDLIQALGCGTGAHYSDERLRYERVIIMTDADVDGAHIASLLMTFFYREMPKLIENGHLFLAQPPLFRITKGGRTEYAQDESSATSCCARCSAARPTSPASRAWARCSRSICAKPRWTRPSASCSRSTCPRSPIPKSASRQCGHGLLSRI